MGAVYMGGVLIQLCRMDFLFSFIGIYLGGFVRDCGYRTAGESLFCKSPKE
jgi:hypothetical protein